MCGFRLWSALLFGHILYIYIYSLQNHTYIYSFNIHERFLCTFREDLSSKRCAAQNIIIDGPSMPKGPSQCGDVVVRGDDDDDKRFAFNAKLIITILVKCTWTWPPHRQCILVTSMGHHAHRILPILRMNNISINIYIDIVVFTWNRVRALVTGWQNHL